MPKSMFLLLFKCFICDFLEFPPGKSSTTFTAHHILWGTNFKNEDVLEFNRTNCNKSYCQIRFSCSCISKISRKLSKYRKTLTFYFFRARADYLSFRPQRACDHITIGSHLKYSSSYWGQIQLDGEF